MDLTVGKSIKRRSSIKEDMNRKLQHISRVFEITFAE